MSDLSPLGTAGKHKRSECRKGHHVYGESQHVGGGILRQVCDTCGEVTIDLTGTELSTPVLRHTGKIGTLSSDS